MGMGHLKTLCADFVDVQSTDGSWSPWFGWGRVDAEQAVALALAAANPAPQPDPSNAASGSSSRVIPIPDNDPAGIEDTLDLTAGGSATTIALSVDIRHSFIGDLQVALVSPSGREALVHDREGGNQQDLVRRYTSNDNAGLAALRGTTIAGSWRLRVRDVAPVDQGELRGWTLDTAAPAEQVLVVEEAPGATIPDADPQGIERALAATSSARVRSIDLELDITHSWIGDLRVVLVSPSGRSALIHDRTGRDADNLIGTWTSTQHAALAGLAGDPAGGDWSLRVVDLEARDIGKLNRWRLRIETMR